MTRGEQRVAVILGSLLCCAAAQAIVSDSAGNPYQGIVDRNVFGLKPPPPPPTPESQQPPAPKVQVTGITDILGKKQALLKVSVPAKPPEPAKDQYYVLTEGQRDGESEVLEIDVKGGNVKLNDYGTVMTLNIEKDGPKLASTPVPGGVPPPGGFNPAGGAPGAFNPGGTAIPNKLGLPSRSLRTTPAGGSPMGASAIPAPNYGAAGPVGGPTANLAAGNTPATSLNVAPGVPTQPGSTRNWPPEVPMSAEEQTILMEVYREQNKNNPDLPPLPTTALTPTPTAQNPTPTTRTPTPLPPLPR